MTAERRLLPPALGAGAALSAMLFASRLPATLDFILPRRAGWSLFAGAFELLSRPGPRGVFTAAVSLLMLGALARFAVLAGAAARGRNWSARDFLARGFAVALVVALLRWSFAIWFEVSQKAWFPLGAVDALEPLANVAACSAIVYAAMRAALRFLASKQPSIVAALRTWTMVNAAAALLAMSAYGAWVPARPAEASRRLFVVLTEEEGHPAQVAYDLPVPAARAPETAGVRRLEALRASYEASAKLMDVAGLRRALLLGIGGEDDLARSLLLAHLSVATPSAEALGALGALADETAHRIGPVAAARIALAYAHLGDAAQAALWAKRGAAMPRGIPVGLLDLSGAGALEPGRVSGKVEGLRPLRVALYQRSDPAGPYLLDAAALVAAAEPDAKGGFTFSGLTAGRYYLAFAFPGGREEEVRVSGHRGDLILHARATALELPALTFRRAE
jgi:hypothetical protein